MEEARKRSLLAENVDKLSKKRRINQAKESNFIEFWSNLDNYLLSAFAIDKAAEEGIGYQEACGITLRTEFWHIISNEAQTLEFGIAKAARDFDLNEFKEDSLNIVIGSNWISLNWSCQNENVFYTIECGEITIFMNKVEFTVTNRNLKQMIERSDFQIRCPGPFRLNNFSITETQRMILGYRNRTEDVLRIFCSSLPNNIFSVIWDFAISDGLLSSKFICGIARILDDSLENSEQHWLKNVSLAISVIIDQFNSSETSYLLEKCSIKASDFKSLGQYAKELYFSD